jgi:hypothetical protein
LPLLTYYFLNENIAFWNVTQESPLPTYRTTQTQNKSIQTSMPLVEFEPTTPVFERAKMVHALDCSAAVIGWRVL